MPDVNYVIHVCFSSKTTPGVITRQEFHTGRKALLQLLHNLGWVIDNNLKRQIKN